MGRMWSVRWCLVALLALFGMVWLTSLGNAGGRRFPGDSNGGAFSNPGVVPPGSMPYGKSYGNWGAAWWQWVFAQPWSVNPLNDQTGANCGQGQSGPVWFLAGTVCQGQACNLATATRSCTVPTGKALFLPVLNTECSTFEGNGTTEAELLACATSALDVAADLECDVDGVQIQNLQAYRAHSGLFTWGPLPADNVFTGLGVPPADAPEGTTSPAVQDGYYIMLAPLKSGSHTVHYHGAFDGFFALDVTYHLTVQGTTEATPVRTVTWGALKTIYR